MRNLHHYIADVCSPLTEANNYVGMFNDFISADANAPDQEQVRNTINKYINWARGNLKKNDRIVWFLRWLRVELAGRVKHTDSYAELTRLNKRLGTAYGPHDLVPISNLMTNLVHYVGMPIAKIQSVVWQKQSPRELLADFGEIESEWKEENASENLIDYGEGEEPRMIMQFPDGFAWFDLNRSYCSRESKAMGHCGNAGGRGTILSLRKLAKNISGRNYYYPVLTFILHSDGYLGEMKGRNNDKPVERYHQYIVALLRDHEEIHGIRGGGYRPENNFSMKDLDADTADELRDKKPGFADIDHLYAKEGMTQQVIDLIDAKLPSGLSIGKHDNTHKRFIVEEWKDLDSFFRHGVYDEDAEKILDIATGQADFQHDGSNVHGDFITTVLELPVHWQERFIARAGIHKPVSDDVVAAAATALMQSDDDWFKRFEDLYNSGNIIREEAWERLSQYVKAGWSFACSNVWVEIPDDVAKLKAFVENGDNVKLFCGEQDMVYLAMASDDDDDDDNYAYELRAMQGDGHSASWETVDDENTRERRREEGLISGYSRRDGDEWLKGIDTETGVLVSDYVAALEGSGTPRIDDPHQHEMSFESVDMRRLMALAGRAN